MRIAFAIAWFLMGLLTYYAIAYAGKGWYTYWYLWDKGNFLILFYALCYPIDREYRYAFKWLTVFAAIRFVWEIISLTTGWNVNNTRIAALLFIILTGTICGILLKELIKWRNQRLS